MALQPGEIIDGKYRIVNLIGEGGMGEVYEGENTRIKRRVAIKVLHAAVAEKTDVVQRFEREAQAAGRIGSEHIVEVLDLGNLPSGERFMVMEFMDGEDLTGRIKRLGKLTAAECVPLLNQILEGLAAAHDAKIIHRDLKPDNIYILTNKAGRNDFVKILDFGVSKFSALDNEMSMTRTGAVMGTPYYMSPEQAKGGKVDNRSDLYAIGVVLYQMLTGRVPFNASSFNELLFKIALESPDPLSELCPDCPAEMVQIVDKAMHRDPEHRFQSAREFQQAIIGLQNVLGNLHLDPERSSQLPAVGAPISTPGVRAAHTPAGGVNLGGSQAALAVTPAPTSGNGLKYALAVAVVLVIAAGGGAAVLMKGGDAGSASGNTNAATPGGGVAPGEKADTNEGSSDAGDSKDGDSKEADAKDGDAKDGDAKDGDAKDEDAKTEGSAAAPAASAPKAPPVAPSKPKLFGKLPQSPPKRPPPVAAPPPPPPPKAPPPASKPGGRTIQTEL